MRIVFSADTHLKPKTWKHRSVQGDSYYALSYIFRYARSMDADAVLLAGDIFDNTNPDDQSVSFFLREAAKLLNSKGQPIPIYTVKGNHDRTDFCGWTVVSPGIQNITNLDGEIVSICNKTLIGYDFCFRDDLIERLNLIGDDIDMVMLHTHLAEALPVGNPQITLEDLPKSKRPRLYLIGDIHKPWHWVSPDGLNVVVYPGVTYPSRVDENYPKQFILITLDNNQNFNLNVIPLPSRPVHRPIIRTLADADSFVCESIPAIKSEVNQLQLGGMPSDIAKPIVEVKFTPVDEIRKVLETALSAEQWCHYWLIPIPEQVIQAIPDGSVSETGTFESAVKEVMGAAYSEQGAALVKDLFFTESTTAVISKYEQAFGIDRNKPV